MNDIQSWIALAQVLTGIASMVTAVIALRVAIGTSRRSREALKVQTYLQLRSEFIDIYRELGQLDATKPASDTEQARQAYWHHVWDEWYITKKLAPAEFSPLWNEFFAKAVDSGYRQGPLKATFEELASKEDSGFGAYAKELIAEVRLNRIRFDKIDRQDLL